MTNNIKDDEDAWRDIFDWLDQAHATIAPSVFDMLAENAILQDRPQSLMKLCTYPPFRMSSTTLEAAVWRGTLDMALLVYNHLDKNDFSRAKEDLNGVFIRCAMTNRANGMENALKLGADINAEDYRAWQQIWHFGDDHTTAVLLKWYARMEDVNPQDPFCGTAKTIADEIERMRLEDKPQDPPLIRAARDKRAFALRMAEFEKEPENFSPETLWETTDGFGNNVLDILGARRQLGLLFDSGIWDHKMGDVRETWSKVAPVYQRMFDIEGAISKNQVSRINRAATPGKWKL